MKLIVCLGNGFQRRSDASFEYPFGGVAPGLFAAADQITCLSRRI